jgi:hypothetical protein
MLRHTRRWGQRLFTGERLEARCLLAADVKITEILASNKDGLADEDGDRPDWIEIFNAGPDSTKLGGWHLTDDPDDLTKWDFPDQFLGAGSFLLVYASNKDRTTIGQPLHTNFRLGAEGEYLALTRDDPSGGGGVVVVSAFDPSFPEQLSDISYGTTQSVTIDPIVAANAAARVLIPHGSAPPEGWNALGFDDASWLDVTSSIGYQQTIPGFTVLDAKSTATIENLAEALAVLNGQGVASQTVAVTPLVNFQDSEGGGGTGNFGDDLAFPNDTADDDNDFAIRATGTITIPLGGTWTFAVNSDDGARLVIDDQLVIDDDTLHAPQDTFARVSLTEGKHNIELIFFERGGGAEVELYAAKGSYRSFNSSFRLVGDLANGGVEIETSPTGTATGLGPLIKTDVGDLMFGQSSSAYVRVPFDVADPALHDSLSLRVNYDDGFVAYLNGVEVARRNAPQNLNYDSLALTDRLAFDALIQETIDISPHQGLLQSGTNVLAIQALNDQIDSDEFALVVELANIDFSQGGLAYFREPTPRAFNAPTGVAGFLASDVTFSQGHGFYDEPFQLTVSSETEGTTIRYTLDGSAPTETNGFTYTSPLTIAETSSVRARSFKGELEPSFVETASFIFLADVLRQSPTGRAPDGWPTSTSINGQTLDYGMDPAIVDNSVWGPQLIEALQQVPTMSIVMNVDDLLGPSRGIYTHANSHGMAWERPASLELMNPDGSQGFQVEMGIRIRGGFSRSTSNPKHAFRFFFREEYGDSKLVYPLFGEEGTDEFDKIDLRTTQNYSWAFQGDGRNNFLRDIYSRDVQGLMGQPYTRGRYYHLYINGQYWGLYQTDERPEARFAASYLGGDPEDYDVVKSSGSNGGYQNEATDGNLNAYRRLADYFYQPGGLSDANLNDYWRAQGMNPDGTRNPDYERLLDVDNLISYMLITYFTSDADGPGSKFTRPRINNYFGIFNRRNPDGFKFFEHDSEHSLDTGNAAGANYNMVTPFTTGGSQFLYFNPHWMHERLAETNSVYRMKFADAVYQQLNHDGVLTVERSQALLDSRAAEFDMAIIAESARWGDAKRATPFTKNDWRNAVNASRNWIAGRAAVLLQQLRGVNWYPTIDPPELTVNQQLQHGGGIGATDQLGFISFGSVSLETILRQGSTWKYLDDGSDQGTAWRDPDFIDTAWASGPAQLGYGDGDEATVLNFGDSSDKFRTTYFRRDFSVSDPSAYQTVRLRLLRDDGAIVYLNGTEIIRNNMPSGPVDYQTFANVTVGGADESTFYDFDINPALLRPGSNLLAVELHQTSATSSDISFDLEVLGGRFDAVNGAVYYTLDGSDPRLPDGQVNPAAARFAHAFSLAASATISARMLQDGAWTALNQATFEVAGGGLPGDLNQDSQVNAIDLDLVAAAIGAGNSQPIYDLDGNQRVDAHDHQFLVENILNTRAGDADLNGTVDFNDFVILANHFGASPGGWAAANFDFDGTVGFSDFVALANNFGFQRPLAALPVASLASGAVTNDQVLAEADRLLFDKDLADDAIGVAQFAGDVARVLQAMDADDDGPLVG